MSNRGYNSNDIAIIGLGGRFPGAADMDDVWEIIQNGEEKIICFTEEELAKENIPKHVYEDRNYVKRGSIIEDIDMFDAEFFGFNPREAELSNPQHRIFLECIWELLENSGYNPDIYEGRIAVFGGEGFNPYMLNIAALPEARNKLDDIQLLIGNDKDFLSTFVSYKLNLRGPSMTIQSACSTSLLGISLACQSLRDFQCDLALAGGIRLGIPQRTGYIYKEGSILSPDGHCKPFDDNANGTVGGNGAAVIALKRMDEAILDRDYIYAVIKAFAVNNDGALKVGYTAPSIDGQAEAIFEALELSEVNVDNIGFIETHGTGTKLGDPIEFEALKKVFHSKTRKQAFCALGSLKANFGHMDAAAGAAGVIKAALALKNKKIPPCVNFNTANKKLNMVDSPFYIPKKSMDWIDNGKGRYAGVSSFGIGGTNVHVVMEEPPQKQEYPSEQPFHILTFSARTETALEMLINKYKVYFEHHNKINVADAAYTLQNGRRFFSCRKAVICRDLEHAKSLLYGDNKEYIIKHEIEGDIRKLTFCFNGIEKLDISAYRQYYKKLEVFRKYSEECFEKFQRHLGFEMKNIFDPDCLTNEEIEKELYLLIPYVFCCEYALAKTLMQFGIIPHAIAGRGLGEYAAGCVAGAFSLEDAAVIIATLGRLIQDSDNNLLKESMVNRLCKKIQNVNLKLPKIPLLFIADGLWVQSESKNPSFWAERILRIMDKNIDYIEKEHEWLYDTDACVCMNLRLDLAPSFQHFIDSDILKKEKKGISAFYYLLAQLWCDGIEINWSNLYEGEERGRVPLPTYPFEKRRCWFDFSSSVQKADSSETVINKTAFEKWFYTKYWKTIQAAQAAIETGRIVLLFTSDYPICSAIGNKLKEDGNAVIYIRMGKHFTRNSDNEFIMNHEDYEDYAKLFQAIIGQNEDSNIDKIVYMWGLDNNSEPFTVKNINYSDTGFTDLINIARVYGNSIISGKTDITVITNHTCRIYSNDVVYPDKVMLLSPCMTIQQEYINITCRFVDIECDMINKVNAVHTIQMINEIWSKGQEIITAYRGMERFSLEYSNLEIDTKCLNSGFKEYGSYLVIGGLGNIGYVLAEYLAKVYHANLVLLGRTQISQEGTKTNSSEEKLEKLKALKEYGTHVEYYSADIGDIHQVNNVKEAVLNKFRRIDGIIHAAGEIGETTYQSVQDSTKAHMEKQFRSKVNGINILDEVFKHVNMDFKLLISSLSTVLGGLGLTNYIAANLYMSSYGNNKGWNCIQLDGWERQGIAITEDALVISSEEGAMIFETALSKGQPHDITISVGKLSDRLYKWVNRQNVQLIKNDMKKNIDTMSREEVEECILQIWKEQLGIENIDVQDNFFELGGDSLMAAQIVYRLKIDIKLNISIYDFFEINTIKGILNYFYNKKEEERKIEDTLEQVLSLSEQELEEMLGVIRNGSNVYGEDVE